MHGFIETIAYFNPVKANSMPNSLLGMEDRGLKLFLLDCTGQK